MSYVLYVLWYLAFAIVMAALCAIFAAALKVIWVCGLFIWEMAL